jgi:uncharacterized repeat protein (TIGR01451 family)
VAERIPRWHWGLLLTLLCIAAGVVFGAPALLAAAALPLVLVAWQSVADVPEPDETLSATRRIRPEQPIPGERVTVELSVRNAGDDTLADVRVADRLPDGLQIVDGAAAGAGALRPGESIELRYEFEPPSGEFQFGAPDVRLRSLSGTALASGAVGVEGPATLRCGTALEELSLERRTTGYGGTVESDDPGPGYEFYATREYRPGDPLNRVDWRRLAKTGALGTIEYREHRSTRTVVLVDARSPARVRPDSGRPDGGTVCAAAANELADALRAGNRSVGLAALGVCSRQPGVYDGPPAYVEPGSDLATAERIRRLCDAIATTSAAGEAGEAKADGGATAASAQASGAASVQTDGEDQGRSSDEHPTTEPDPAITFVDGAADGRRPIETLLELLPPDAQVVICSPLLDAFAGRFVRELRANGVPAVVLSPDLSHDRTPGARLLRLRRQSTVARLRAAGVPIVDWDRSAPLRTVLEGPLVEGLA